MDFITKMEGNTITCELSDNFRNVNSYIVSFGHAIVDNDYVFLGVDGLPGLAFTPEQYKEKFYTSSEKAAKELKRGYWALYSE